MKKLLSVLLALCLSIALAITCVAAPVAGSTQQGVSYSGNVQPSPKGSLYYVDCLQMGPQTVRATFLHLGPRPVSEVLVYIQYVDSTGGHQTGTRNMGAVGAEIPVHEDFYIPNYNGRWYTAQAFYTILLDGEWYSVNSGVLTNKE